MTRAAQSISGSRSLDQDEKLIDPGRLIIGGTRVFPNLVCPDSEVVILGRALSFFFFTAISKIVVGAGFAKEETLGGVEFSIQCA